MTTIAIETTATPTTVTGTEVFVPLNKLKKHPDNARKLPHSEASIAPNGGGENPELEIGLKRESGFRLLAQECA